MPFHQCIVRIDSMHYVHFREVDLNLCPPSTPLGRTSCNPCSKALFFEPAGNEPFSRELEDVEAGKIDLALSPLAAPSPLETLFKEDFVCLLGADLPYPSAGRMGWDCAQHVLQSDQGTIWSGNDPASERVSLADNSWVLARVSARRSGTPQLRTEIQRCWKGKAELKGG